MDVGMTSMLSSVSLMYYCFWTGEARGSGPLLFYSVGKSKKFSKGLFTNPNNDRNSPYYLISVNSGITLMTRRLNKMSV